MGWKKAAEDEYGTGTPSTPAFPYGRPTQDNPGKYNKQMEKKQGARLKKLQAAQNKLMTG